LPVEINSKTLGFETPSMLHRAATAVSITSFKIINHAKDFFANLLLSQARPCHDPRLLGARRGLYLGSLALRFPGAHKVSFRLVVLIKPTVYNPTILSQPFVCFKTFSQPFVINPSQPDQPFAHLSDHFSSSRSALVTINCA
jgi:hypothetical protein